MIIAGAIIARLINARLIIARLIIAGAIVTARLIVALLIRTLLVIAGAIVAAGLYAVCLLGQMAVHGVDDIKGNRIGLIRVIRLILALIRPMVLPKFGAIFALAVLALMAIVLLTAFLFRRHLAHRFGQHTGVMFGVLREVFCRNPII